MRAFLCFVAIACLSFSAQAFEDDEVQYCVQPPHEALCPHVPHDQLDFERDFVYRVINEAAQFPFDNFSWQSFIALNWPIDPTGQPLSSIRAPRDVTRQWHRTVQTSRLFSKTSEVGPCGTRDGLVVSAYHQASGEVLIDQNLNFVVYDTRMNKVAVDYLRNHGLISARGQAFHAGTDKSISFPMGSYEDEDSISGGQEGALVIKTSWRILTPGETTATLDRYFTQPGHIELAAPDTSNGEARCVPVNLGLVGMHIIQRTISGNGDRWIWSTFEHRDNAPDASNARGVNSIYEEPLFANGCINPERFDKEFSFYSAKCPDCSTNEIKVEKWKWAEQQPFAKAYAKYGMFGTQVVRCWKVFEGTERLNALWRKKLTGTVWQNYFLISTQWRGNYGGGVFGDGEVPRFLTNTTLETYGQDHQNGSCIGCHTDARTTLGQNANFSFLLMLAQ